MAKPPAIQAMQLTSPFIKMLVHGEPGVGKTPFIGTSPRGLILEADEHRDRVADGAVGRVLDDVRVAVAVVEQDVLRGGHRGAYPSGPGGRGLRLSLHARHDLVDQYRRQPPRAVGARRGLRLGHRGLDYGQQLLCLD